MIRYRKEGEEWPETPAEMMDGAESNPLGFAVPLPPKIEVVAVSGVYSGDTGGDVEAFVRAHIEKIVNEQAARWIDKNCLSGDGRENAPPRDAIFYTDGRPVFPEE